MTQEFHLPVLAGHDGIRVTALVDPNLDRTKALASAYGVPHVFAFADSIDRAVADAAVVAAPAIFHAPVSQDLMRRGLHVLVEKPMALSTADAERMVALARETGLVLTVGLFRRLLPAVRLMRAAIDAGEIGDLVHVEAEAGDTYTWNLTTMAGMSREQAGGGILADMGPHVFDLLLYVCDARASVVGYSDNGGTGIETDCEATLLLDRHGLNVPARVELSRTRRLRNAIRIQGTRDTIEWSLGDRDRVRFRSGLMLADPATGRPRPCAVDARWEDEVERIGYEGFRAQVDDWLGGIRGTSAPQLSAASVVPSVTLLEECYANRVALDEPWFTEALPKQRPARTPTAAPRRVLVTGASGFIGCRLSERLHLGSDWTVRALVRAPGRAVRLARLPLEFALGDLTSPSSLATALEGCSAVVHAGIGTSWRRTERLSTTVQGTKDLVDAALRAGVERFVHVSTIALYGDRATGTLTEDTPPNPTKGDDYAESKYAAEQIVLEAAAKGLPAIVLRVAVVYGPHNLTITARPLEHLARGRLVLVDCRETPSNTIYVDNLCHAIGLSLEAGPEVNGQVFLLSDDDGWTWGEYFGYFGRQIGAEIQYASRADVARAPERAPSALSRWVHGTRDLVTSPEVKALVKRVYQSQPWGTPARAFVDRFPGVVRAIASRVRPDEAFVYRPAPATAATDPPFVMQPMQARVSADKARRLLGYKPIVPRERALALTLAWATYARIVRAAAREGVAADR